MEFGTEVKNVLIWKKDKRLLWQLSAQLMNRVETQWLTDYSRVPNIHVDLLFYFRKYFPPTLFSPYKQ